MISVNNYLKSLNHAAKELPIILKEFDKLDDDLYWQYIEQFEWLLSARVIFLYQTKDIKTYLKEVMNFNHQILSIKEELYHCMGITEQEIICLNFKN